MMSRLSFAGLALIAIVLTGVFVGNSALAPAGPGAGKPRLSATKSISRDVSCNGCTGLETIGGIGGTGCVSVGVSTCIDGDGVCVESGSNCDKDPCDLTYHIAADLDSSCSGNLILKKYVSDDCGNWTPVQTVMGTSIDVAGAPEVECSEDGPNGLGFVLTYDGDTIWKCQVCCSKCNKVGGGGGF